MTGRQIDNVIAALSVYSFSTDLTFLHGMCIGADEDFDQILQTSKQCWPSFKPTIVGYPGVTKSGKIYRRSWICKPDVILEERQFLDRNRDIASICDLLWACPKEEEEQLRSGTWATTRYARKLGKPVIIFSPAGVVKLVDAADSKSVGRKAVRVQVPSSALN